MVLAKKWMLVKPFDGDVRSDNFKLEEEELSDTLKDGDVLIEAVYHSVDPYMRTHETELGVMVGTQVAKVLASKSDKFPVGAHVTANVGWRTRTVVNESEPHAVFGIPWSMHVIPPLGDIPLSTAIGVLGMPGMTAYYGFLNICTPKEGEVVLVNGAAGAVGSLVGQIAKIKGCTVIGFAGSKEKCDWLKELGFDFAFNYKTDDIEESIKKAAPDGIDCYFDNVGGEFTTIVLNHMKEFGRISYCGSISSYNKADPFKEMVPIPWFNFIVKQLRAEGFIVLRWIDKWPQGIMQMAQWIKEGKIKYQETFTDGFEKMPEAFMGLFKGSNLGKAVVKS